MISRIDRRGRSGQVTVRFNGRDIRLWLGFELVDSVPDINGGRPSEKISE